MTPLFGHQSQAVQAKRTFAAVASTPYSVAIRILHHHRSSCHLRPVGPPARRESTELLQTSEPTFSPLAVDHISLVQRQRSVKRKPASVLLMHLPGSQLSRRAGTIVFHPARGAFVQVYGLPPALGEPGGGEGWEIVPS